MITRSQYNEIESAYYRIKWNAMDKEVKQSLQSVAKLIRKVDSTFNKTSRNTLKDLRDSVWSWMVANEPDEEE